MICWIPADWEISKLHFAAIKLLGELRTQVDVRLPRGAKGVNNIEPRTVGPQRKIMS